MKIFFIAIFTFLMGCSPSSLSEWRVEGVSVVRSLVEEFQKIHSLEELKSHQKSIKKKYNTLVQIMIEAENYEEEEGDYRPERFYSDALRDQYIRLYLIEGCKEYLFSIQKDSLHKLDRLSNQMSKLSQVIN